MAARFISLRRAFSFYVGNKQHRIHFFQEQLPQSRSLLSKNSVYGTLFQRRLCVPREAKEDSVTNTGTESAKVSSTAADIEELKAKFTAAFKKDPRNNFMMVFTCRVCDTTSMDISSFELYTGGGLPVARCGGCGTVHVIGRVGDGCIVLGEFDRERGAECPAAPWEEFKRESKEPLNLNIKFEK